MRITCYGLLIYGLLITSTGAAQQTDIFKTPERGFASWLPAPNWEHALLSGNGTLGAMVFGNPHEETIILNHSSLFLPQQKSDRPIDQASRLEEIRKLMLEGKFDEATKIPVEIRKQQGYSDERDPFIPAFDLYVSQQAGNVTRYNRTVNFETGEAAVNWQDTNGTFQRKLFVSRADSVIVLSIKGTAKINASLHFEHRPVEWQQWGFVGNHVSEMKPAAEGGWLTYRSVFTKKYPGSLEGYEGVGRLVVKGGSYSTIGNTITVKDADEVLLVIRIAPNYTIEQSAMDKLKHQLLTVSTDYDLLLRSHTKIHGELFSRSKLDLKGSSEDRALYSEEIILKAQTEVSLAMIEKVYDAGRYTILSSTGNNPPNLQGLWGGTWTAPWTGGFTNDGNLPVAISGLLPTNMPELMDAFFRYHENLMDDYRVSAKTLYNCRGIHIPAQTTTSGWETDFGERWCLTFWTGAAGWAAAYFYDYYLYTGDKNFLSTRAYPFMKESALFYEDFLTTDRNGKLIFNPSYSPENNPGNSESQAAPNATMDVMIARQLLRNCIAAATTLKTDADKIKTWQTMLSKMPAYEIAADGSLREWLWPGLTENHRHRHISHLYSLYDMVDPDFATNDALKKAATKVIDEHMKFRIAEQGGEMAFGLSLMAATTAHLGDTERTYQMLQWLASKYWSTGFASFHNVRALFNTDISGGIPYVITQMLTYSEPGTLVLFPALPAEWKEGSIEGILLRSQVKIKRLEWNERGVQLILNSPKQQYIKITSSKKFSSCTISSKPIKKSKDKSYSVQLKPNEDNTLEFKY